jgi:hypothetical protein
MRLLIFAFAWAVTVASAVPTAQGEASLGGTWNVHINHDSGRVVDEQWIIEENHGSLKGRVKTARQEFPLEATRDGSSITVKVILSPDRFNIFRGTVDGDTMKGSIELKGVQKPDDGTFSANRQTTR